MLLNINNKRPAAHAKVKNKRACVCVCAGARAVQMKKGESTMQGYDKGTSSKKDREIKS